VDDEPDFYNGVLEFDGRNITLGKPPIPSFKFDTPRPATWNDYVAVCCSVLQCVAVCCSVLQCVALCCIVPNSVAMSGSVMQCGTVLQCVLSHAGCARCIGLFACKYLFIPFFLKPI